MSQQFDDKARLLKHGKRLVIKIGSSLLVDEDLRRDWLDSLIDDIAELMERGCQVLLVSSGAIALGRKVLSIPERERARGKKGKGKIAPDLYGGLRLDESQAAAAVGQIELARSFARSMQRRGLVAAQILLTLTDTEGTAGRRTYLNARDTIGHLLKLGAVPVINENDTIATSEIRYGDNDRLAARVATMMEADLLILLSDVHGLYSRPPADKRKDAQGGDSGEKGRLIESVEKITPEIEAMAGASESTLARGGMATKIEAGKIAAEAGTAMVIASGRDRHPIAALEKGAPATWFAPQERGAPARKAWISGQLKLAGRVLIDAGAVKALRQGKSLLPAGVLEVQGEFDRGDAIAIADENGRDLGRGLSEYDCREAKLIAGKRSDDMAEILGYEGRANMIHRDNMALSAQI